MTVVYLWPTWLIIGVEIVVVIGLAVGGHIIVRRLVPHRDLARHNDVAGFLLAIVGVIYAVLLAFVVVITWEALNTAEDNAQNEVSAASDIYRLAKIYKDPQRAELRHELLNYAQLMKTDEWPAMQTGGESEAAHLSAERITDLAVQMIDSDSVPRAAVDNAVVTLLHTFLDARRARLRENDEGIPVSLWAGLILGAILTMGFTYLFGVENFRLQLVMTTLLAALIAVMFSMIVALDYPFRGSTSISSAIWTLDGR